MAQEGAHRLHAALDLHRLPAVRPADDDPHGLQLRRGDRRTGSAGAHPQGEPDHAAAGQLSRAPARHRGCRDGHAQHVVRRRLPGPVELLRADRRRTRAVHEALSGIPGAAGSDGGVARRSPGRDGGRGSGQAVWLEGGRPRADPGHHLAAQRGPGVGVQHRRDVRRRTGHRQDPVLLPLRLPEREPATRRWPGGVVHREDCRSGAGAGHGRHVRRDVRQLLGRNQDHDREGLRRRLRQTGR